MKELKIRGIVGNSVLILTSLLMIGFLFMPMLASKNGEQVYSIFESMFNMKSISQTMGSNASYYIIGGAFMISFFIFAIALLVLSIISLIGVCLQKPKFSMAVATRALSLISAVASSLAIVFVALYHQSNDITTTTFGFGLFVELAISFLAVAGSFTAPTRQNYITMTRAK